MHDARAALARACDYLLSRQHPDGHFDGTSWQHAASTAQVVIVEHVLGALADADRDDALRFFAAQVRPDGSFVAYHGATFGTLSDACQIDAALACCGLGEEHALRASVRGFIAREGGPAKADIMAQAFMVLGGTLAADRLPSMPIAHVLVPGVDRWLGKRFLAYYAFILGYLLPGLVHGLRARRSARTGSWLERRAARAIADYLVSHQNPDGDWAGGQWVTCMALGCLSVLGLPRDHASIVRGLAALERFKDRAADGLRIVPYNCNIWNTAVVLRALELAEHRCPHGARDAAIDYLLDTQCKANAPRDWSNTERDVPPEGGWSAMSENPYLSDTDTTAMAIWALDSSPRADVKAARRRGLRWLVNMQNDDGGFASFARALRTKPAGPLYQKVPDPPTGLVDGLRFMSEPPFEFVEHSTADLTGRVVAALGALGHRGDAPEVRRARAFLDGQLEGDRWWGRWTTNYLAATAFILHGLAQVGTAIGEHAAVVWLVSCQNADGGWGEQNASYADPSLAGRGPSNAYTTGLVVLALLAAGGHDAVCERAITYLVTTQAAHGGWVEREAIQVLLPPTMFYTNETNFQVPPIEALASWLKRGAHARG